MKSSKDDDRHRREEHVQVLEGFIKLIRRQLENSTTLRERASDSQTSEDYKSERRILMQVNQLGLGEGVMAGVLTFVFLRRAPHAIAKRMVQQQKQQARSGTYKLDESSPFESSAASSRPPLPLRVIRFGLDCMVSLVVAASTSFYFTDLNSMMKQVANIPLVEGKSLVSDEFCVPLMQEYARIQQNHPNVWNQESMSTSSKALQSIRTFVYNCHLRQAHEKQIREQQEQAGIVSSHESIKIPHPGVNKDIVVDLEKEMDFGHNSSSNDDGFFDGFTSQDSSYPTSQEDYFGQDPTDVDKNWADSMVSDREEDDRGGRGF